MDKSCKFTNIQLSLPLARQKTGNNSNTINEKEAFEVIDSISSHLRLFLISTKLKEVKYDVNSEANIHKHFK